MENSLSFFFKAGKKILLPAVFMLISLVSFAQTEDFEGETLGGTTFTTSGVLFNVTGDFLISEAPNFSCGASNTGTNRYLDTGFGDGASSGVVGTIAPAGGGVTFQVSTTVAQCAWTGESDGNNNLDGTIRITGTKTDMTTISEDFFIDTTIPDDELVPFTFSAGIWAGMDLTSIQVEIVSPAGVEYVAFDNFVFEDLPGLDICPTVGAVAASETAVCANDPFNVTATGLATMDMATNGEQDFGIEFVAFTSTPADPYVGGTTLGTVPFGSLTAGNTTAALVGATLGTASSYEIYAILSPAPDEATCRPSAMTSIIVNAAPSGVTINISSTQDEFCVNDNVQVINFTGSPTGGVYTGTGVTDLATGASFAFDPATAGVGTHIVTYTVTNTNGCSASATDNIVVNALPTVTFTALADLCVNAGVQNNIGGGTPTGGVYSGSGVTDDGNGMTYDFDPASAGVGTHTITYTFTDGNGCENSADDDVEVFAVPNVMFTALADLCINAGVQNGLGGGTPTGGVYSGTGVTDDGNGMTYSFDPAAAGVGTHTITYTVGVAGCSGSAMDDVEVFALPVVTLTIPASQDEFCVDAASEVINFSGAPTGGVYSGPGVTDLATGASFLFTPSVAGVGTHTVTYTLTDANGCTNSATDNIVVNALPTVTFTALADLCLNDGVQAGQGGGTPTGGVYSGTGVTDDGNGMTYSFDPASAGVGTHTITYTFTDGNGCENSASDDVEVFAIPNAMFTALADLCVNAGVQNSLGGGTPTGGIYSGTGVTDDGNGMTYSFDPASAGVGTHTITYTVGVSGCSDSAMDDVEVFALPSVTMSIPAAQDEFCVNAANEVINFSGAPTGGVYSGPGVTDLVTGASFLFSPSTAGVGTHTVTYTLTDANGCSGTATDNIVVNALPTVTFTAPVDLCVDAGVQNNLGGGSPTGTDGATGVYSGDGVSDDGNGTTYDFDPAAAGVGTHTITYTFTDANGCTNTATDDVEVFALPVVTFTALADLCVNDGVQTGLGGGMPAGGVYSGIGVTDNGNGMTYSFDPAASGVGPRTITYTFTDANGCTGMATDDVQVFSIPTVDVTLPETYCADAGTVTAGPLVAPTAATTVYSGTGVTDNGDNASFEFDVATVGVGVHPVTVTLTNANACSNVLMVNITVLALPTVAFTAPADLCIDAGVQTGLGGGTPPEGTAAGDMGMYSGDGVSDDGNGMTYSFDPASAGVGTHTITYTYTDENGCTNTASDDIEVFALPIVSFTAPMLDVCIEDPVETGLGGGMPTGGVYSGTGVTDDGNGMTFSFDPTASAPAGGNVTVTYTFTDANGCSASATDDIFVNPICCMPPTIACPADNFGLPAGCNPAVPAGTTMFNIDGAPAPNPAWPTVAEGCEPLILTFADITTDIGCMRMVTRTYTITDDNGDIASCDQVFTFTVDTEAPTLSAMPGDETVECDAIPAVPMITATDNCEDIEEVLFINEIHYDNAGTDVGEFLEIAGTAGIDLSLYEVYAYEAFDGMFDAQVPLSGIIPNEGAGFGALAFTRTELPNGFFENGSADAIALVEIATGEVIKFISYEGTATASNGPAAGMTSTDIGVAEDGGTMPGESLQLEGLNGCPCTDFTWTGPTVASPGLINSGQSFDLAACPSTNEVPVTFTETSTPGTCPQEQIITRTWTATDNCGNPVIYMQTITVEDNIAPEFCDAPMNVTVDCEAPAAEYLGAIDNCDISGMNNAVWVNEFHYDNTGGDTGEFIEIAGVAGTDLTGYQLVTYNGANGLVDDVYDLSGVIDAETCNRGALSFLTPGLQNGSPDGFALVQNGTVLEFLSYEGNFTANNGAAMGMTSTDVGVSEPGTTPVGFSLQLTGAGSDGTGFTWTGPAAASPGSLNTDQEIQGNLEGMLTEVDNTTVCDGGTVTRTWNASDACGNAATPHVQVITVNAPEAPEIVCPADETVECSADIIVDAANAMVTVFCDLGSNVVVTGPAQVGPDDCPGTTYTYTYTVTDDCGRSATCDQVFTIDNQAPIIICPADEVVTCFEDINADPNNLIVTTSCGLDFNAYVKQPQISGGLPGCDGTVYTYIYKVVDACGRSSECEQQFLIQNSAPIVTVPAGATVDCYEDIEVSVDDVTIVADCEGDHTVNVIEPVVDPGQLNCPGVLTYTYRVRDACNRVVEVTRDFTIAPSSLTIEAPADYISECGGSPGSPDNAVVTTTCGTGIDFEVTLSGPEIIGTPGCSGSVYRYTYTVEDACGRTASDVQNITIQNAAPIVNCPEVLNIINCEDGDHNALIEAWAATVTATSSCGSPLTVSNNYNGNAGLCIQNGVTNVTFFATDECGRTSSCVGTVIIADTEGPIIYQAPQEVLIPCNAVTEDIFEDWLATQGGAEAIDGCWGNNISWSTNPSNPQLNCAGGPQAIVVEFIATDGCGNSSSVTGIFNTKIQPDYVNVSGNVSRENTDPVANVQIGIAGGSAGVPNMDYTETSGGYGLPEIEYEENLMVVPEKNDDPLNGVTTYDLVLLQQHILFMEELDSPYKRIAADINRSGGISTFDLVLLRRLILHVDEEFSNNTSWRFVESDFVFPNEANPFETAFPEIYMLGGVEEEEANFVGVKIGDLDLSAITNELMEAEDRTGLDDLVFEVEDRRLKEGEEYEIEFTAQNFSQINGFQFTLNIDETAFEFIELEGVDLINFDGKNYGTTKLEQGAVTVSWNHENLIDLKPEEVAFSLRLRSNKDVVLSEVLAISSEYTVAEAYQSGELMNVELAFEKEGEIYTNEEFRLFQNQPNPFKESTMIGFNLPEGGMISLEVFDVSGRVIYKAEGEYAKGYNQINVDRSDLPGAGILYYQITTATDSGSKKMILIE